MNEFTPYPVKRTLRITLRERTSPVKVVHDSSWHLQVHGCFSTVKSEQNACMYTFRINQRYLLVFPYSTKFFELKSKRVKRMLKQKLSEQLQSLVMI